MEKSVVTIKGQIVIPVKLRKKIGIKKGTQVFLEEREGSIIVHPATSGFYQKAFGILKGDSLTKKLEKSRRKEKAREGAKIERG
jgi:AbrB family looped-hinge helix DNA binding protein